MTSLPRAQARPASSAVTGGSAIAGVGIYLPADSAPAAPRHNPPNCLGVAHRVQAACGISTATLAAGAARAALEASGVPLAEIEFIVVGTTSPDVPWPSTACLVQAELGLPKVGSFDLYAAEAGLLTALGVADRFVRSGTRAALVIGAECDNQLAVVPPPNPRSGRAASALVLQAAAKGAGLLATVIGGQATPASNGSSVGGQLKGVTEAVDRCLEQAGLSLADVDLVLGEQTAPEIMRAFAREKRVAPARLVLDPDRYRGSFAAAPFVVLHDVVRDGRLQEGMTALLISCGSGPAWAVACLRWGGGGIKAC